MYIEYYLQNGTCNSTKLSSASLKIRHQNFAEWHKLQSLELTCNSEKIMGTRNSEKIWEH